MGNCSSLIGKLLACREVCLFYSAELKHLPVCLGFLWQGEGVGTGGRRKAVEHHLLSIGKEARYGHILPHWRHFGDGERVAYGGGGFLACGDDYTAMWHTMQEGVDVGGQDNLQELVRGIVLQAAYGGGGVVEAYALVLQEGDDEVKAEGLCLGVHEMVLVAKENKSLYAPVVVDEVGIVEVHAPALPLWRETAQEEHTAVLWQKGVQRMVLYPIDRAGYVLKVEEGGGGIHFR